ncbi:asparagine synthase (glutamine-hydrolyzing) [Flagellimonas allohymeniacidonis]|uniref:asparagine synthase (glutamine-hydrolyzing) n=1 Tax=Flagellimonas allohymeniacidonis TaxID=2517819 RepID=A0A4V2HSQ0_9FLAO|nr:asparagine synthase (glutamine-hydrolyzing) [Allomuricauda hymeniacidonis]TAI48570.1 asparagine synthase (glutamine-hydrolyzing) [Allomuricauda hymeniacidonis]
MCGINGLVSLKKASQEELHGKLKTMNDSIIHRGPDDDGSCTFSGDSFSLGMAMRRLSIIDLTTGKQPIQSEDGKIVIVFNGEIYNYRSLKSSLLDLGKTFNTQSDTEVILKLYETYGEESFSMLDGMFAFSIYDQHKNKVFVARDFFGEKPLYYTKMDDSFIWASELKSITKVLTSKPPISVDGLNLFFRLTYIPAPYSIYEGIHKLEANHYMVYDLNKHDFQIKEITPYTYPQKQNVSFDEAKKHVKELVYESVASRSISDVPLGTFLSGGVDSSIVSLCLSQHTGKKIDTFSIGFTKTSFDETDKSRLVAKHINSNHHEFIIGEVDLKDNIHEILINFDEPFSDTAALPTELISRKTKEHVKVALTGDGGDEVFGGYNKYYIGMLNRKYTRLVPEGLHRQFTRLATSLLKDKDDSRGIRFKIRKFLNAVDYANEFYWDIISLNNTDNHIKEILNPTLLNQNIFDPYKERLGIAKPISLTDYRLVDWVLSLEGGMLPKVDRTSMMNSLECRAPFLNRALWEYTNSLPENFLMKGWNKKYILKEAFRDQFPENFLDRSKSGFGSPVGDWLRLSLRKELESYIEPKFLEEQGIFNIPQIINLVKDHLSGKRDSTFRVWGFYCFQKWYTHNGAHL